MVSAWVTMAFATHFSATGARGMCAEHVLGVSSLWVLGRPDVELFGEHKEE